MLLRQEGRCADCGTRLILGFFVFDHRPALALRAEDADANEPEHLAAICWSCDQAKTPRDLKEIARAKRLAAEHQDFLERQREKLPGHRVPSPRQWRKLARELGPDLSATSKPPEETESSASDASRGSPETR
jgi:hypothetical protein